MDEDPNAIRNQYATHNSLVNLSIVMLCSDVMLLAHFLHVDCFLSCVPVPLLDCAACLCCLPMLAACLSCSPVLLACPACLS